jgi:hypothetical protein
MKESQAGLEAGHSSGVEQLFVQRPSQGVDAQLKP